MASGRMLSEIKCDNLWDLEESLRAYEDHKIGVWGCAGDLHEGNKMVANRVRALSDVVVGINYVIWGNLIESFTGCHHYVKKIDVDKIDRTNKEMSKYCDIVYTMNEDIFLGQYGYTKQDLWEKCLAQYPTYNIHRETRGLFAKEMLVSHFRTAQAMLIVFNDVLNYDWIVRVGCMRDAWRWELIRWYNEMWSTHMYYGVAPLVDQYGNSLSSSRDTVNRPILLPTMRNKIDVQEQNPDWDCMYFFRKHGYLYAGFIHDGRYFIEGVQE